MKLNRVFFVLLLLICTTTLGSSQGLEAQGQGAETDVNANEIPVATHDLNVGEYSHFGAFSLFRLYTDYIFDPEESSSADVRCFHGLDRLNPTQHSQAFDELRSGNMSLASKIEGQYYVVEAEPAAGLQGINVRRGMPPVDVWLSPNDGTITYSGHANQLQPVFIIAGNMAASQNANSSRRYWNALRNTRSLGVVASRAGEFDLPCETIVNWHGAVESVGHVGFVFEEEPSLGSLPGRE